MLELAEPEVEGQMRADLIFLRNLRNIVSYTGLNKPALLLIYNSVCHQGYIKKLKYEHEHTLRKKDPVLPQCFPRPNLDLEYMISFIGIRW